MWRGLQTYVTYRYDASDFGDDTDKDEDWEGDDNWGWVMGMRYDF